MVASKIQNRGGALKERRPPQRIESNSQRELPLVTNTEYQLGNHNWTRRAALWWIRHRDQNGDRRYYTSAGSVWVASELVQLFDTPVCTRDLSITSRAENPVPDPDESTVQKMIDDTDP
jgi:hypothetical protein